MDSPLHHLLVNATLARTSFLGDTPRWVHEHYDIESRVEKREHRYHYYVGPQEFDEFISLVLRNEGVPYRPEIALDPSVPANAAGSGWLDPQTPYVVVGSPQMATPLTAMHEAAHLIYGYRVLDDPTVGLGQGPGHESGWRNLYAQLASKYLEVRLYDGLGNPGIGFTGSKAESDAEEVSIILSESLDYLEVGRPGSARSHLAPLISVYSPGSVSKEAATPNELAERLWAISDALDKGEEAKARKLLQNAIRWCAVQVDIADGVWDATPGYATS